MNWFRKALICIFLIGGSTFIVPETSSTMAQCPMCRIAAESNLKNGGTAGKGLNKGIVYLFVTPYLLIGGLAYFWYKNRKNKTL